MELDSLLRTVNILMAFIAVPPAVSLIQLLIKERPTLTKNKGALNSLLIFIITGIAFGAIANAIVSLLAILVPETAHSIARLRSLAMTSFFALSVWGLNIYKGKIK